MSTNNIFYRLISKMIQTKTIINHPFKTLIEYLKFNSLSSLDDIDICDLYFALMDNYYSHLRKSVSKKELEKRKEIKDQNNIYLQIALMDPKIFDDDEIFDFEIGSLLEDYKNDYRDHSPLIFIDEKKDECFKNRYKKILNLIKKINDIIENKCEY